MFCGVHHQCCVWCTPVTCQLSAKSAKHSSNTVFLGIDFILHAISVQMVEVFKPKLCAFLVHHTTRTHSASVWQLCCVTALHHLHTTYTRCRGQATSVALGFVGERRRYVVGGAAMAEPAGGGGWCRSCECTPLVYTSVGSWCTPSVEALHLLVYTTHLR